MTKFKSTALVLLICFFVTCSAFITNDIEFTTVEVNSTEATSTSNEPTLSDTSEATNLLSSTDQVSKDDQSTTTPQDSTVTESTPISTPSTLTKDPASNDQRDLTTQDSTSPDFQSLSSTIFDSEPQKVEGSSSQTTGSSSLPQEDTTLIESQTTENEKVTDNSFDLLKKITTENLSSQNTNLETFTTVGESETTANNVGFETTNILQDEKETDSSSFSSKKITTEDLSSQNTSPETFTTVGESEKSDSNVEMQTTESLKNEDVTDGSFDPSKKTTTEDLSLTNIFPERLTTVQERETTDSYVELQTTEIPQSQNDMQSYADTTEDLSLKNLSPETLTTVSETNDFERIEMTMAQNNAMTETTTEPIDITTEQSTLYYDNNIVTESSDRLSAEVTDSENIVIDLTTDNMQETSTLSNTIQDELVTQGEYFSKEEITTPLQSEIIATDTLNTNPTDIDTSVVEETSTESVTTENSADFGIAGFEDLWKDYLATNEPDSETTSNLYTTADMPADLSSESMTLEASQPSPTSDVLSDITTGLPETDSTDITNTTPVKDQEKNFIWKIRKETCDNGKTVERAICVDSIVGEDVAYYMCDSIEKPEISESCASDDTTYWSTEIPQTIPIETTKTDSPITETTKMNDLSTTMTQNLNDEEMTDRVTEDMDITRNNSTADDIVIDFNNSTINIYSKKVNTPTNDDYPSITTRHAVTRVDQKVMIIWQCPPPYWISNIDSVYRWSKLYPLGEVFVDLNFGHVNPNQTRGFLVKIKNPTKSMAGFYTCTEDSDDGSRYYIFRLDVNDVENIQLVTTNLPPTVHQLTLEPEDGIDISCSQGYYLFKDGTPLGNDTLPLQRTRVINQWQLNSNTPSVVYSCHNGTNLESTQNQAPVSDTVRIKMGPRSCMNTLFGCCPDGITPSQHQDGIDCSPVSNCASTPYGCCPGTKFGAIAPDFRGCEGLMNRPQMCFFTMNNYSILPGSKNTVWYYYDSDKNQCYPYLKDVDQSNPEMGFVRLEDCKRSCVYPVNIRQCRQEVLHDSNCTSQTSVWFYESLDMVCKRSIGCYKGKNIFSSEEKCNKFCDPLKDTMVEKCLDPANITGESCSNVPSISHVYYNKATGQCEWFKYMGCRVSSGNRFANMDACERECQTKANYIFEKSSTYCNLPRDIGQCPQDNQNNSTLTSRRWYFEAASKECKEMTFFVCKSGNANNFLSESDCTKFCNGKQIKPLDLCQLRPDPGEQCHTQQTRWYYNVTAKQCQQFFFKGCGGNGNRFDSQKSCMNFCHYMFVPTTTSTTTTPTPLTTEAPVVTTKVIITEKPLPRFEPGELEIDPCKQNMNRGHCTSKRDGNITFVQRYYYNRLESSCHPFNYTGCGGTENNFDQSSDCNLVCAKRPYIKSTTCLGLKDTCYTPADGEYGNHVYYYYSKQANECSPMKLITINGAANTKCKKKLRLYFTSLGECKKKCTSIANESHLKNRCFAKITHNRECDPESQVVRFFYIKSSGSCVSYITCPSDHYTNSFQTLEDCEQTCTPTTWSDVCRMPMDKGPCNSYHLRYYYNHVAEKCTVFTYGGCLGNLNRFVDARECENTCLKLMTEERTTIPPFYIPATTPFSVQPEIAYKFGKHEMSRDICLMNAEIGTCMNHRSQFYLLTYYYSAKLGRCEKLSFVGCGAGPNFFETQDQCDKTCTSRIKAPDKLRCHETNIYCHKGAQLWEFRPELGICVRFESCSSAQTKTGNQFQSESSCIHTCVPKKPKAISLQDICFLEKEVGDCKKHTLRWYFDTHARTCKSHMACAQYGNNFATEKYCESTCMSKTVQSSCMLPVDHGPCINFAKRWYYDITSRSCQPFLYGGCLGNRNRFRSYQDCSSLCQKSDYCTEKPVGSPSYCQGERNNKAQVRFFFNQTSGACETFAFVGCINNSNNFRSIRECEMKCQPMSPVMTIPSIKKDKSLCTAKRINWQPTCSNTFERIRFYYDAESQTCKQFLTQWCLDDSERKDSFTTKESCQKTCMAKDMYEEEDTSLTEPNYLDSYRCQESLFPQTKKDCAAQAMTRFFYNKTKGECQTYLYFGCDGLQDTGNRFSDRSICEKTCVRRINMIADESGNATMVCPECNNHCEYGRERLPNGCWSCTCLNPCTDVKCPEFHRCQVDCQRDGNDVWGCVATCHPNSVQHPERCLRSPNLAGHFVKDCGIVPPARYYYDWRTGMCRSVLYTGCNDTKAVKDKTMNWFYSMQVCKLQCAGIVRTEQQLCIGIECPKSQKCVAYCEASRGTIGCNTTCRDITKPGSCPMRDPTNPVCTGWKICTLDAHCVGDKKCCECEPNNGITFCQAPGNCSISRFGCCPNSKIAAKDEKLTNCPTIKPQILPQRANNITGERGDTLNLVCKVIAAPKPTIIWRHYSFSQLTDINLNRTGRYWVSHYTLKRLNFRTAGPWSCEASNDHGTDIQTIQINFRQPEPTHLPSPTPTLTVGLRCRDAKKGVNNDLQVETRTEDMNNIMLVPDNVGCCQDGVTRVMDAEMSNCPQAPPFLLDNKLMITEKTVRLDKDLVLRCMVGGVPPPSIEWYKNGTRLEFNRSSQIDRISRYPNAIRVAPVRREDESEWHCSAVNVFGSINRRFNIKVIYEPVYIANPFTQIRVREGDSAYLFCDARGQPTPTIAWYLIHPVTKARGPPLPSTSRLLFLENIGKAPNTTGSFLCQATNSGSQDSQEMVVYQLRPEQLMTGGLLLINPGGTLPEGGRVVMDCRQAKSQTVVYDITWYKDAQVIEPSNFMRSNNEMEARREASRLTFKESGSQLILDEVKVTDSGEYSCRIRSNPNTYTFRNSLTVVPFET